MIKGKIWIIDFGSQYTQLISRRTRELGYYSQIITYTKACELINGGQKPEALILSGGPRSIFDDPFDYEIFFKDESLPILGICYGLQIIGQVLGGEVERGSSGEYGLSVVHPTDKTPQKFKNDAKVWMSHFDHLKNLPTGFDKVLTSENGLVAGILGTERPVLGLQFHPEVHHTENGRDYLDYFLNDMATIEKDWNKGAMLEECKEYIQSVSEDDYILCAFSGGVDSLVAASVCQQMIKKKLYCFFVDNGLLRPQDYAHIKMLQAKTNLNIEIIDAKKLFLDNLKGLKDPEDKRKMIGRTFIDVFEQKVHEYEADHGIKFKHLLQGTLYPDVIESVSPHGDHGMSVTIKSHHNVGGLPEKMNLKLLEPLRSLFKDEVRIIGEEIGLNKEWVFRHPFPGPGLGVRILGEISAESIRKVQMSDQILFEELTNTNQYNNTWQAFTVLLPVKTVGVKGDVRAYEEVIAVRMVDSTDGMTATPSEFSLSFLTKVSSRIANEVAGVTRVVYDITTKPPGTIEWE